MSRGTIIRVGRVRKREGTLSSKGGNGGIVVTDEFEMEDGLAGDKKGALGLLYHENNV
jgi:hypothetical protein